MRDTATHRIYLIEDQHRRIQQADRPTNMFYEIDADHPIERHGTAWMKIIRAKGKAFKILYGTAPGVRDDLVITNLGARMRLMDNHWYVDVMNVDPYKWMPLKVSEPMSVLQRLAMIVAAVTILVVTFFGSPTRNFTPALILSAIIVILCVVADNIKKRRNN